MTSADTSGSTTEQIGPYRVLETIGAGTMARVVLAEQEGPGGFRKKVALKVIKDEFAGDDQFIKLLMREAAIGGMLRHPNIIQTLAFEHYEDSYVLVLEYVEGQSIAELLEGYTGRGLAPGLALDICIQCCRALSYAHSLTEDDGSPLTIVHRDLKPANLMRSEHGVVKIMDFGIARATATWAALTAQGVIRGSPSYMSPEQVLGKELDGRSDLFSLGSILYELLVGDTLFKGTAVLDVLESVARVEIGQALDKTQAALPGAEQVVAKLLAPHPDDRYPSATAASEDLKVLLLEATGVPVSHNKMASRVSSIDDLSGVSDISVLLDRDIVGSGGTATRVPSTEESTVSGTKPPTRKKKTSRARPSRKSRRRAKADDSAKSSQQSNSRNDDDQMESFIYAESPADDDELIVFEEVDEAKATQSAASATSTAISQPLPARDSQKTSDQRESESPAAAHQKEIPWVNSFEKDFFSTGPQSLPPGSMGPDGPEIDGSGRLGDKEDELLDATVSGSRPPTDAVAKDVLEANEPNEPEPAEPGTSATLDLPSDDDELWTDSEAEATSRELAMSMEHTSAQPTVREDSLWSTEKEEKEDPAETYEQAETQPALPKSQPSTQTNETTRSPVDPKATNEQELLDTETVPIPAVPNPEQQTPE